MVKLIVIARCIPEDVYLAHADRLLPAVAGKKFSVVVREPDSWYIGRLAIEIGNRYEALYKRPLGQIKYLKDAEDDCDLDLELTVADLLVDEGKALQDSSDQKRIVLVVVDQGRAVRQGSVVPDLTPLHYQPAIKPPVPKFPGIGKRIPEEPELDNRHAKRRRLDQIEDDDGEEIVHSIETQNGLNNRRRRSPSQFEVPGAHFLSALNTGNVDRAAVDIKRESPGPQPWADATPATRDELELLPQQPRNWRPQQRRTGLPPSRLQNGASRQDDAQQHVQQSAATPTTPGTNGRVQQSPSANAINMLNGMKSVSPALRQPASSTANKFRGPRKNVYDVPESDVEDSQMSPESRAGRKPITPRLVPTPRSVDTNSAAKGGARLAMLKKPVTDSNTANLENTHDESTLLPDGTEAADRELSRNQTDLQEDVQMGNNMSWERDGFSKLGKVVSNQTEVAEDDEQNQPRPKSKSSAPDEDSTDASSVPSKKSASRREGRSSSGVAPTSRSSSVASSASGTGRSTSSRSAGKKASYIRDRKTLPDTEEDNTLDSPGLQLEENLRQSSPVPKRPTESRSRTTASKTSVREDSDAEAIEVNADDEDKGNVTRPPDSVSDFEEAVQPAKSDSTKRDKVADTKTRSTSQKAKANIGNDLRCYTCWHRKRNCDNARPKCSTCVSQKKNCQIYSMTREAADEEKETRKSGKGAKSAAARPSSRAASKTIPKTSNPQSRDGVASASDGDEASESEADAEDDSRSVKKHGKTSKSVVSKPKPGSARQKKKVDKKKTNNEQRPKESMATGQRIETEADADVSEEEPQVQQPSKLSVPQRLEQRSNISEDTETSTQPTTGNPPINPKTATVPITTLDTQCSVVSATGFVCPRPLGCKLHGMATKRAVPGRSQPFDVLLKRQQQQGNSSAKEAATGAQTQQSSTADNIPESGIPTNSAMPAIVHEKSGDSAFAHAQSAKAPSVASRTSSVPILPSGMTMEEYTQLMNDRSGLTAQEWSEMKKKLASKKASGLGEEKSPLMVRSQASQSSSQKPRKSAPSVKSDDKVTSSSQASKRTQAPVSIQPEPNSHTFATATTSGPVNTLLPKSAPSKSDNTRQTATDARINGRLKMHPSIANTAASLNSDKHSNPPYRQPLRKPATSIAVSGPRSLKDLRGNLKSHGSGASTPQPQSARDKMPGLISSVQFKRGFQLADEEEDEDEEDEEDEEDGAASGSEASPVREESNPKTPRFTAVNSISLANLHHGKRQVPQDEDGGTSESSDDDEWSK